MPQEGNMQVGVFYRRVLADESLVSFVVDLGGGEGNLVQIWACHWNFETLEAAASHVFFLGAALSSNPEHENTPLESFEDFQFNKALYARTVIVSDHFGTGDSTVTVPQQIIPVYGLVRPRRQIAVIAKVALQINLGIGLEIYYTPVGATFTEREEVNRKYGKYRRS